MKRTLKFLILFASTGHWNADAETGRFIAGICYEFVIFLLYFHVLNGFLS